MTIAADCAELIRKLAAKELRCGVWDVIMEMRGTLHEKYPTAGFDRQGKMLEREMEIIEACREGRPINNELITEKNWNACVDRFVDRACAAANDIPSEW